MGISPGGSRTEGVYAPTSLLRRLGGHRDRVRPGADEPDTSHAAELVLPGDRSRHHVAPMRRRASRTSPLVALAAVVLAAGPTSCASDRIPCVETLVIVTLDTTRADRLPAYGDSSVATPALDRLAREGVVFDRAESVAPLTLPAHSSLFTGLYPPHHGVRDNADQPLDVKHATLAEIVHARGLRTAAFVGSTVLAADRGLARGFGRCLRRPPSRS